MVTTISNFTVYTLYYKCITYTFPYALFTAVCFANYRGNYLLFPAVSRFYRGFYAKLMVVNKS